EGVQIADDQLERRDAVQADGGGVGGEVGATEDRSVNERVQGLDPAVHDFREAGISANIDDSDAEVLEELRSAPGGNNLRTHLDQALDKGAEVGLVADAAERPFLLDERHLRLPKTGKARLPLGTGPSPVSAPT